MTEPSKEPSPPPLPDWVTPPVPNPADANKKSYNPTLLILAGLIAILIFASIVILGIVVSRFSFHTADSNSSAENANPEETVSKLTDAIRNDPKNADLYLQRGITLANANRYPEAIDDYNRVTKLQPDNGQAYFLRGNLEEYSQQFSEALADYGQAIRFDPKPGQAYQRRGKLYFKIKKYDGAVSDFTKVIDLLPNPQTGYWDRAMVYAASQNHQKAIEDYTSALSFRVVPNILEERGEEYLKSGDYQHALSDFNETLRLKSGSSLARFGRAKCYYQLHDYDHVIEDCTALIQRAPRFADAYRLRAQAYQQKQQSAQANADLQTAQRLQPK
jgi:tetratricopeptide (TPR) repeat protein